MFTYESLLGSTVSCSLLWITCTSWQSHKIGGDAGGRSSPACLESLQRHLTLDLRVSWFLLLEIQFVILHVQFKMSHFRRLIECDVALFLVHKHQVASSSSLTLTRRLYSADLSLYLCIPSTLNCLSLSDVPSKVISAIVRLNVAYPKSDLYSASFSAKSIELL